MSPASNGPEPEILPPGSNAGANAGSGANRHRQGGMHDAGFDFDDLGERAEKVLRHPMTWPRAAYVLYALSVISGLPMLIGLILAYIARGEAPDWQKSHYTFMIHTFWYFVVLVAAGAVLALFLVGFALLWVLPLWVAIRVIRGWMLLENHEPVPNPQSWLFG